MTKAEKVWASVQGVVVMGNVDLRRFEICDDCGEAYAEPAYYTFPTEACAESIGGVIPTPHQGCTGNLCPDCAIDLMPDDEDDPRRQEQVLENDGWHSTGVKP